MERGTGEGQVVFEDSRTTTGPEIDPRSPPVHKFGPETMGWDPSQDRSLLDGWVGLSTTHVISSLGFSKILDLLFDVDSDTGTVLPPENSWGKVTRGRGVVRDRQGRTSQEGVKEVGVTVGTGGSPVWWSPGPRMLSEKWTVGREGKSVSRLVPSGAETLEDREGT